MVCVSGGEDSAIGGVVGCVCVWWCRAPRAVVVICHVQLV